VAVERPQVVGERFTVQVIAGNSAEVSWQTIDRLLTCNM
jgi:hypothetical protein